MSALQSIEHKLCTALGLRPRLGADAQLARALQRLRSEHGLSPEEVLLRLDTDREGWLVRSLGGALTVDESFFFRHPEHFTVLEAELRSCQARAPATPVVIWSAGCATGEEPYSMAIAVQRALGPNGLRSVRIFASDINEEALQVARRAVYGRWSFRGEGLDPRTGFFSKTDRADEYQLDSTITQAVNFQHRALSTLLSELRPNALDVIFFRNVAIYFTDDALARAYTGFARVLKEGGLLVLGPADPLPVVPEFVRERRAEVLVHRKQTLRLPANSSPPRAANDNARVRRTTRGQTPTPRPAAASTAARRPDSADIGGLAQARRLADRGQTAAALSLIDRELEHSGANAERLGLRGRIHLAAGHAADSAADLERALSIDPAQLVLRFYFALALEALHRNAACSRELRVLLSALQTRDELDSLNDDVLTSVASLRKAAEELLRRVE